MKITSKIFLAVVAGVFAIGWSQTVLAQISLVTKANMAVQITDARKANGLLMRQYSWTSRTELLEGGQVKDNRIELVNCGPDGQLQRSLLNDSDAPLPFGFLRRAIAEQKRQEMEQYLTGLRSLLDQYTLSTAGKVLDFMDQGITSGPDASGLITMTGINVVVTGDNLSIWTKAATKHTSKVQANTFYQGNVVELTATFNLLPSGLNYMAFAEVTIPAKQMSIQVQNFDYNRNAAAAEKQPAAAQHQAAPAAPPSPPPAASGQPLPLGTVVSNLPAGCTSTPVGGVDYFYCGGNFYRPVVQENKLVYVTVQPK